MMRGILAKIYAWALLLATIAGICVVAAFAWTSVDRLIASAIGLAVSLVIAPLAHELGHVLFAKASGMKIVYCKCFCFRYYRRQGKARIGFALPFSADETQVLPCGSEKMQKRALAYAVGGLVFSGVLLLCVLTLCVFGWVLGQGVYFYSFYAALPYVAYLFFLNAVPAVYASGKTDAAVMKGIRNADAVEQTMLNLMRIHGGLQSGKSYAELPQQWYFSAPQIAEDEPLFVAILEARYRYYLEKEELENAFDCLKRIRAAGEYLNVREVLTLECNLAYLCLVGGNDGVLKEAVKNGGEYWQSEDPAIKRTLALYMQKCGEAERADLLIEQAKRLLKREEIAGLIRHEEILLARIK